jgi:capsular polysaccharide biosynthesis protein
MTKPTATSTDRATLLHPERVSRRRLPVNFKQDEMALFEHELERVIPPTRLLELRGVGVSSDGLLFKAGKILPESFAFPWQFAQWKKRSVLKFFVSNYLLKKRRRFERPALWIVDVWSTGYFHWLADALTRLFTVRDRLDEAVLLLPHQYEALDFVRPSLEPFGVRNLEFISPGEVLFCDRLITPTQTAPSGHYNEELIRGVSDLLVGFYNGSRRLPPSERVYISRSRAAKRNIRNEEEVIDVLRGFDFKIVHAEEHTFAEQVKINSDARYLVSNHGAGLTNMLFMSPGTSVLELRHRTDRVNNCYFTMASALNLNYFYQTCESENPGEDPHTAHLLVDARALGDNLKALLAS